MMIDPQTFKRILVMIVLGVVVLLAILDIHHLLTTGKISLVTNRSDGSVKVLSRSAFEAGGAKLYADQKFHKVSERLKPGDYVAVAYTNSAYTNQAVTIKARQKTDITLNLNTPGNPQPVIEQGTTSISVNGNLYFLSANALNYLAPNNALNKAFSGAIKKIRWASPGTALMLDNSDNFYLLQNGATTQIPLPFVANNNPSIDFSMAPNGTLYVSNGQTIFLGTAAGNLTQVYSSGNNYNSGLAASNNGLAFIEKTPGGSSSLVLIKNGSIKKVSSNASQIAWSPEGTYLATSPGGGKVGTIYDASLTARYTMPNLGPANLVWSGENTLLYDASNSVWSYDLGSQQSAVLANLAPDQKVTSQALSDDGSYLYFADSQHISKVSLNAKSSNNKLSVLNSFMPGTIGVCVLNYLNFATPTIEVTYPLYQTTDSACLALAKSQIKSYGLDPGAFQYNISAFTPD
jgi:hypothetical protein